jgi:hypothetical protein
VLPQLTITRSLSGSCAAWSLRLGGASRPGTSTRRAPTTVMLPSRARRPLSICRGRGLSSWATSLRDLAETYLRIELPSGPRPIRSAPTQRRLQFRGRIEPS